MNYDTTSFHEYASLVISTGINLQPGQRVLISTGYGTYPFARLLAQKAYQAGAGFVKIEVQDKVLIAHRAHHGNPNDIDYLPPFIQNEYETYVRENWARIAIEDLEDLESLAGLEADVLGRFSIAQNKLRSKYREAQMADVFPWVVIAVPGPHWAARMGLTEEDLWGKLRTILRLDLQKPPVKAWSEHSEILAQRSRLLNELQIRQIRFCGPETDLTVCLTEASQWLGGGAKTLAGRPFLPNIPTEEVFTTPHFGLTRGRVKVTRPVEVLGTLVKDAWFEFDQGRVISFGAGSGYQELKKYLSLDAGASYLGEVALVGEDSPLASCGLIFGSVLLDENASCHIALGAGYPTALRGGENLKTEEALKAAHCNVSIAHTDFMIGGPEIDVTATTNDGIVIAILKKGQWVISKERSDEI